MAMKKLAVWCEHCGGMQLSCCAEWIVFDRLSFCSPDCRTDYQDQLRRRNVRVVSSSGKTAKRSREADPRSRAPSRSRTRASA